LLNKIRRTKCIGSLRLSLGRWKDCLPLINFIGGFMEDEATINLRAFTEQARYDLQLLLEKSLNDIPDDTTNILALEVLNNFEED